MTREYTTMENDSVRIAKKIRVARAHRNPMTAAKSVDDSMPVAR
jgi:hypothetical protein